MVNVFEYTDYRKFLKDYYIERKKTTPHFSYRFIALHSGINEGNFARILRGKNNLSMEFGLKLAGVFKLNKRQTEYFQNMVLYGHAKNHEDKKRYFTLMMGFRESKVKVLNADQYEFYEKWYYTAVREALSFFPLNENNFADLGKIILPAISEDEVKKAIALLLKLGMIEKSQGGTFKPTDALISTGNEAKAIALNNFIINSMKLAEKAINLAPGEINLSSVSFSISTEDFNRIQEEVRACRQKILEIAKASQLPDQVYQLNLHLFPLTKKHKAGQ